MSQQAWPAPLASAPHDAPWLQAADGPLVACRNGLHACMVEQLAYWISDELWEVELGDEWIETRHSVIARRARLVRRIEAWEGAAALEFTEACRERARTQAAQASQLSTLATQYLESTEQFARDGKAALTAYVAALFCSALGPSELRMISFDAERREQSQLLARTAGLT